MKYRLGGRIFLKENGEYILVKGGIKVIRETHNKPRKKGFVYRYPKVVIVEWMEDGSIKYIDRFSDYLKKL